MPRLRIKKLFQLICQIRLSFTWFNSVINFHPFLGGLTNWNSGVEQANGHTSAMAILVANTWALPASAEEGTTGTSECTRICNSTYQEVVPDKIYSLVHKRQSARPHRRQFPFE